jgi:hypothetical protein
VATRWLASPVSQVGDKADVRWAASGCCTSILAQTQRSSVAIALSARGFKSKDGGLIASPLRSCAQAPIGAAGAPGGIGLSHGLLRTALADEQDAERQERNAHIGSCRCPRLGSAFLFDRFGVLTSQAIEDKDLR